MSLGGMADSGYAVNIHYDLTDESFCNFGQTFNCDIVNGSEYSELFGVPVAAIGFAGYLLFGALAVVMLLGRTLRGLAAPALVVTSAFGVAFSLALTYIELFILEAVCILCVTSQVLVLLILAAAIFVATGLRKGSRGGLAQLSS